MTTGAWRSRFSVASLVASSLVSIPLPAFAQPSSAPLADSLTGEARDAYKSGRLLFADGDNVGALAKFKHAFDVSHDPRLLWNMAVCEKELRHYGRSATLIQRYLKQGGTRIAPDQRQSATETQDALRAFYSTVALNGAPAGSTVLVDGTVVGTVPLGEPLLVDLGTRTLRVEQDGFEPFETKLEVAGASQLEVRVDLHRAAVANEAPARLSITSSGERDIVAVDGKVVASQHWEGPLAVGEHSVRVSAPDKKTYETRVQLTAGSTRSLQVSLESDAHGAPVWLWVAGGAAVVAGGVVGGYFLFKSDGTTPGPHPDGKLATVYLSLGSALR